MRERSRERKKSERNCTKLSQSGFQFQCTDSSLMPADSWYAHLTTSQEAKTNEADESWTTQLCKEISDMDCRRLRKGKYVINVHLFLISERSWCGVSWPYSVLVVCTSFKEIYEPAAVNFKTILVKHLIPQQNECASQQGLSGNSSTGDAHFHARWRPCH